MTTVTFETLKYPSSGLTNESSSSDFTVVEPIRVVPTNASNPLTALGHEAFMRFYLLSAHTYDLSSVYPSMDRRDASAVLREAESYLDPASLTDARLFTNMLDHDLATCHAAKTVRQVRVTITRRIRGNPLNLEVDELL